MWSYYGSKSKIVDLYPKPQHDRIIEPFAGSARYSLKYFEKDILLVDKYDVIVRIWKWLQQCSESDIMNLPVLNRKEIIPESLSEEEKWFVSFNCARGTSRPQSVAGNYEDVVVIWRNRKKWISKNLHKIRHWKIVHGSYDEIENTEATWFIDPPYKFGGSNYKHPSKNIDYEKLAAWCKERVGQKIVCENSKADWLDFKPMSRLVGQKFKTTEVIWSNLITSYDNKQTVMF